MSIPHGIITAIITPFTKDGKIDFHSYEKCIDYQIKSGIHAIIPCGTTGESPTLSKEEKKELITKTLELCNNTNTKVIAGTGSNNTQETCELSIWASEKGVCGLLIVTPYYNKPTSAGQRAHFTSIADKVSVPIMLYNVPSRTGISMTAATVAELSQHKNITCIKEASGNVHLSSEILCLTSTHSKPFNVFSGDDSLFVPLLSIGGCGVVSVASNFIPKQMVQMWEFFQDKNWTALQKAHKKYFKLFNDFFIEANPSPIKWALSQKGLIENHLRLPLLPLSTAAQSVLNKTINECTKE